MARRPGERACSFTSRALIRHGGPNDNAGLSPPAGSRPAAPGARPRRRVRRSGPAVRPEALDGTAVVRDRPPADPGQPADHLSHPVAPDAVRAAPLRRPGRRNLLIAKHNVGSGFAAAPLFSPVVIS